MMASGAKNFVPWAEYLRDRAARVMTHSVAIGVVLYFGGFWN